MAVLHLNSENFEKEVLEAQEPVLVDFYADWCGPCKMVGPFFQEVSEKIEGVKFAKVNVDEEGDLAKEFGVQSIPTLVILKNKQEIARKIGFVMKNVLEAWVLENTK